jgi:SAM-dependent methyltransferase
MRASPRNRSFPVADVRGRVPERLARAVELLDPAPHERILEVGCGPGVAAALICERLVDGHLTAIDRSATAVAGARRRNAVVLAAGLLDLRQVELGRLAVGRSERFDAVLAVNVNLFWTGPADDELRVIGRALRPDGRLVLAYETPRGTLPDRAIEAIERALQVHGFTSRTVATPPVLAVLARPS